MRICLDIRYTTRSGASTFIEGFLRNLPLADHDHTIELVSHRRLSTLQGIGSLVNVPFRNRLLEFQWSQTMLPRHLRTRQCDVYHSLKHVGPICCPVKSVYRVPAVGQFVGQYPQRFTDQMYWSHAARHAYRRADLLIAVSDYVRHGLIEFLGLPEERVQTIHNGVDGRFRRIAFDQDEAQRRLLSKGIDRPFLLSVANLVQVKNLDAAIEACCRLEHSELQLVLAGNDRTPHAFQLKERAKRLGIANQVVFLGTQRIDDLMLLYNRAELLVHPSFHEGFSSTLLEAMACGLPIVASNTTSIPETVGDAGIYHSPDDVEGQVDCILKLLGDSDLRERMSRRALQRVQQFTWDRCVQKTMATYGQLN